MLFNRCEIIDNYNIDSRYKELIKFVKVIELNQNNQLYNEMISSIAAVKLINEGYKQRYSYNMSY